MDSFKLLKEESARVIQMLNRQEDIRRNERQHAEILSEYRIMNNELKKQVEIAVKDAEKAKKEAHWANIKFWISLAVSILSIGVSALISVFF